jgi:hypothetical protein
MDRSARQRWEMWMSVTPRSKAAVADLPAVEARVVVKVVDLLDAVKAAALVDRPAESVPQVPRPELGAHRKNHPARLQVRLVCRWENRTF